MKQLCFPIITLPPFLTPTMHPTLEVQPTPPPRMHPVAPPRLKVVQPPPPPKVQPVAPRRVHMQKNLHSHSSIYIKNLQYYHEYYSITSVTPHATAELIFVPWLHNTLLPNKCLLLHVLYTSTKSMDGRKHSIPYYQGKSLPHGGHQ